ncbi:WG repeat-containing protein [Maribacter luteus]|nr:WG repeat-containing protein [Maribacter luteus]
MIKPKVILVLFIFSSLMMAQTNEVMEATSPNNPGEVDFGEFQTKNNKYGIVKKDGTVIVPYEYDSLSGDISRNRIKAIKKNKIGLISSSNEIIIPIKYQELEFIQPHYHDFLKIRDKNKYGIINLQEKVIITNEYDDIRWHKDNFFIVTKNGKVGAIDKKGTSLMKLTKGNDIQKAIWKNRIPKYFIFKSDDKFGLVDINGNVSIPPLYFKLYYWNDYDVYNAITSENKWGVLDEKNNELLPLIYERIVIDQPDFIVVKKNNKYGVVDIKNNLLIPFEYDKLFTISSKKCGSRHVGTKDGTRELLDNKGLPLIKQLNFDNINFVDQCLFETRMNNKLGLMDMNGKIILKNKFKVIKPINSSRIIASEIKNFKLFDFKGSLLTDEEFEEIRNINSSQYLSIKKNNKYGLINFEGKLIKEPVYDKIQWKQNADNSIYGVIGIKKIKIISDGK